MLTGGAKLKRPLGRGFEPAKWVVKQVFNDVMKPIAIDKNIKTALFTSFYEACCAGDPRRADKVIYEHLERTGWDWPLFRKWECEFDRYNAWPRLFTDYLKYRANDKYGAERQLTGILSTFMFLKIYSLVRFQTGEDCAASSKSVYRCTWKVVPEDNHVISKQLADKFNRHELDELPPFFPGDSCRLELVRDNK